MVEPLNVDTSRLQAVGAALQALRLPEAPQAPVVVGADAISQAIGDTIGAIEGPVHDGLPALNAVLARTASNIVAAAQIYAETDYSLGAQVDRALWQQKEGQSAWATGSATGLGAAATSVPGAVGADGAAALSPGRIQQASHIAGVATEVSSMAQSIVSTVSGSVPGAAEPGAQGVPVAAEARGRDAEERRDSEDPDESDDTEDTENAGASAGDTVAALPSEAIAAATDGIGSPAPVRSV